MNNYKELIVWQKSMLLVELVYKQTDSFPVEEIRSGLIANNSYLKSKYLEENRRETLNLRPKDFGNKNSNFSKIQNIN